MLAVATFGENLKRIRESREVTQEVLAARLGLKRSAQISLMESSRALPKAATIVRVAEALGVPAKLFLDDVTTDYDRIRAGQPISAARPRQVPRKMAVGESPPVRQHAARGKGARFR